MNKKKKRPIKCKQVPGGKLGDYVWMGLYITRHPLNKKFWAVRDVGDFGPSIEGYFRTLSDCCDAIEDWLRKRDLSRKLEKRKHFRVIDGGSE